MFFFSLSFFLFLLSLFVDLFHEIQARCLFSLCLAEQFTCNHCGADTSDLTIVTGHITRDLPPRWLDLQRDAG